MMPASTGAAITVFFSQFSHHFVCIRLDAGDAPIDAVETRSCVGRTSSSIASAEPAVFQQRTGTPAGICLTCRFGTEIVNSAGVPIGADRDPSIQTHSPPISIRCHLSEWGPDSVLKHT